MAEPTGYEPLDALKPFARDVWIVDGPRIRFYGMPFPTRMSVVRLEDGGLWLHSPIRLTQTLLEAVQALGPVRHLVAPNAIHYAGLPGWAEACPAAKVWATPGTMRRAAGQGVEMPERAAMLGEAPPEDWAGEIGQVLFTGSALHREVVFLHDASRTAIFTDLIENFVPRHQPWWMRPILRMAGIVAPDGRIPPDIRASFDRADLRRHVRAVLDWGPKRVIVAHGLCYEDEAVARLQRAFRKVL